MDFFGYAPTNAYGQGHWALDFNGVKTVSLVDAYAMTADKQLKWLTWKVHIPRSGLFVAK